jgi:hypothetical protein
MTAKQPLVTVLAILLLLALTGLGVGYGLWYELLSVEGEVETGYLDADWTFLGCYDNESTKDVGTFSTYIELPDKNVAHFTINNGYPQYMAGCQTRYHYYGSIPVHVEAIDFIPVSNLTNCVVTPYNNGNFIAECDQLTVQFGDGLCEQLHYGYWVDGSVDVTVKQAAAELTTYEFAIEWQLNQFNESACP